MKNIIITGSCDIEVLGVSSLLEVMGIPTIRLRDAEPEPGDLLIVCMSVEPLLGWAKFIPVLLAMRTLYSRCSMVVLVPNKVASVRLLDMVGCIVSGGGSLGVVRNALLCLVTKWRQGKPLPVGNVRRISANYMLGAEEVIYFFTQMISPVGSVRLTKTEYGRRSRAVVSMGFCALHQLKLFMASVDSKMLQTLLVSQLGFTSLQASCKSVDISRYANANELNRYLFSAEVC